MEKPFKIVRTLKAPRELVFEAFTQEQHLKHWWGPTGMQLEVIKLDVREGGSFHYKMIGENGMFGFGIFHYRKINAPNSIEFTSSFADETGEIIRPPFPGNFPLRVLNVWEFSEENGETTITLQGWPLSDDPKEIDFFAGMHESMNGGFSGTFANLEAYLTKIMQS
ncbi:MAG: SRPBCC domain-containing protein [Flavobacteriales bacterium]|nr:SRPBCC domain-containing protein [Flavobacteriales bacterium]